MQDHSDVDLLNSTCRLIAYLITILYAYKAYNVGILAVVIVVVYWQ